jgi:hypothetical protein
MPTPIPATSPGGADRVAPFLGIKLRGSAGRTHKIAEHDREIAALANGLG